MLDSLDYELIDIVGAKSDEWRPIGKSLLSIWLFAQSVSILWDDWWWSRPIMEGDFIYLGIPTFAILLVIAGEAISTQRLYGFFLGIVISLIVILRGVFFHEPLAWSLTVVTLGIIFIAYLLIRRDLFLATADEYELLVY